MFHYNKMECQKAYTKNLLNKTSRRSSKFTTKNWVEIKNESRVAVHNTRFKTITLKSSLCDYNDAHIL